MDREEPDLSPGLNSTRRLLEDLGFAPDTSVLSDESPGLSFNFGNFKLQASWQLNRWFVPIVLVHGVYSTSRTLAMIEQQLPLEVESSEQGKAFVAWCLQDSHGEPYETNITPDWLIEGRNHFDLLPWKREIADYEARPRCYIRRDWARVALKELGKYLAKANPTDRVMFSFDGECFRIFIGNEPLVVQAHGAAWPETYSIAVSQLSPLPKRLTRDSIEVSIRESNLQLHRSYYSGLRAEPTVTTA